MSKVCGVHFMHERGQNQQDLKRGKNAHFLGERECFFWLTTRLGKRQKRFTSHSLAWRKLELEAVKLWWSVGESGEENAFSSFP